MAEPYIGEIRIFGFNFAPRGYAECDGQLLPINQNQSLFSILGTTYGGDGRNTFGLPDLRGRVPMHDGSETFLGQRAGEESVVLTTQQIPSHTHEARGTSAAADSTNAGGRLLGETSGGRTATVPYADGTNLVPMAAGSVSTTGGAGHENMQPFTTLMFAIALSGTFPPRN